VISGDLFSTGQQTVRQKRTFSIHRIDAIVPGKTKSFAQVQVQVFIDTLAAQRPNNLIKREKV